MQEAYSRVDEITAEARKQEEEEQKSSAKETEEMLKFL